MDTFNMFRVAGRNGQPPPQVHRLVARALLPLLVVGLAGPLGARAQTASPAAPTEFPADAQVLTAQALKERLASHAFKATLHDQTGWRLMFKGDYIYANISTGAHDSGTWRTEGSKLCVEYQRFPNGCSEMRGSDSELFLKRTSTGEVVRLEIND